MEIRKYFRKYESKLLSYNKVHVGLVVFYEGIFVSISGNILFSYESTKVRKYNNVVRVHVRRAIYTVHFCIIDSTQTHTHLRACS